MKDAKTQPLVPDVLPSDRETAYHHWAYVSERNAAETARALGLPVRTVQDWVSRDGWKVRYDQERGDLAQRVRDTMELALIRAMPSAIQALVRIIEGDGDLRQHVTKDGEIIELEEFVPYMARVNAVKELRSMFDGPSVQYHTHTVQTQEPPGNGHTTGGNVPPSPAPTPLTREAAAAMSPEERQQWERSRRST